MAKFFSGLIYWPIYFVTRAYMRIKWDVRPSGYQNVPTKGPVILAANHLRFSDSPMLAVAQSGHYRRLSFLAKSELFVIRGPISWIVATFLRVVGQIPIDRSSREKSLRGMAEAEALLKNGGMLGIHVEGTRSLDGLLYKARSGFAYLAQSTKATIVPVGIIYTQNAAGKKGVDINFGEPIVYEDYKDMSTREMSKMITKKIQKLSGQHLADRFAEIVSRFRLGNH